MATQTRNKTINLRLSKKEKTLIDRAAKLLDRSQSDFMLEAACREAEALRLDQNHFSLSEEKFKRFMAMLDEAPSEKREQSSIARELLMDGLKYKMLVGYKEGKVSLAKLSKMLGITLSEAVDLLSSFGLQSPISYDDYLEGMGTARKAVR